MFSGDYWHLLVSLHGRNFDLIFCLLDFSDFVSAILTIFSNDLLYIVDSTVYYGTVIIARKQGICFKSTNKDSITFCFIFRRFLL